MQTRRKHAVVTGASTGIGEATVRALSARGWKVTALARRIERLQTLASETNCDYFAVDLADEVAVAEVAAKIINNGPVDALVNNAGGALGVEKVADALPAKWEKMYKMNVLTALNCTRFLLPALRESKGAVIFLTSTAAHDTYPGGAGYVAAKHAERIIANTLRIELAGEPLRVMEIAPGMVKTEEFSLNRLGSVGAAEKVYEGVAQPLLAEDVAQIITWMLELPGHINIDSLMVRPVAQASNTLVRREL